MKRVLRLGMSLRTRLTLWYGALLAVTLLAFSGLVYFTLQQSLSSSMDERLTLRADQLRREVGPSVGNLLQPEDVAPGVQLQSTLSEFVGTGVYVQLLNQKAAVIATPPNLVGEQLPVPPSSREAIQEDRPIFDTVPVQNNASVRLLTQPLHLEGTDEVVGAVQVAESLSPFENTMAAVARLLLFAGAGALLLAVVVGWLLTRAALRPVFRITDTAGHIAATGDYRQRIHVTPPRFGHGDELFFLASTFNDMIARLEYMLESQRRLLADTSHELRNPITIIRGNLALLRRPHVPESSRAEAIVEAEEEAARMGRLVADLLLLARADAGDLPSFQRERVDLGELVTEVVELARPRATAHNLSVACDSRCMVLGDRDRLKQLVTNLVENAIRYTPAADASKSRSGVLPVCNSGVQSFVLEMLVIRALRFPWRSSRFQIPGLAFHPPTCHTCSSGSTARTRHGRGHTVVRDWACQSPSTWRRSMAAASQRSATGSIVAARLRSVCRWPRARIRRDL